MGGHRTHKICGWAPGPAKYCLLARRAIKSLHASKWSRRYIENRAMDLVLQWLIYSDYLTYSIYLIHLIYSICSIYSIYSICLIYLIYFIYPIYLVYSFCLMYSIHLIYSFNLIYSIYLIHLFFLLFTIHLINPSNPCFKFWTWSHALFWMPEPDLQKSCFEDRQTDRPTDKSSPRCF